MTQKKFIEKQFIALSNKRQQQLSENLRTSLSNKLKDFNGQALTSSAYKPYLKVNDILAKNPDIILPQLIIEVRKQLQSNQNQFLKSIFIKSKKKRSANSSFCRDMVKTINDAETELNSEVTKKFKELNEEVLVLPEDCYREIFSYLPLQSINNVRLACNFFGTIGRAIIDKHYKFKAKKREVKLNFGIEVKSLACLSSGEIILTVKFGNWRNRLILLDSNYQYKQDLTRVFNPIDEKIKDIFPLPEDKLACLFWGYNLEIFDIKSKKYSGERTLSNISNAHLSALSNGSIVHCDSKRIRIWDLTSDQDLFTQKSDDITSVAVTQEDIIITGYKKGVIRLWDKSGQEIKQMTNPRFRNEIKIITCLPDNRIITVGHKSYAIWDLTKGECQKVFDTTVDFCQLFALPGEKYLVSRSSADKIIRVWHTVTGQCIYLLGEADFIALQPDGKIITGCKKKINIYSIDDLSPELNDQVETKYSDNLTM